MLRNEEREQERDSGHSERGEEHPQHAGTVIAITIAKAAAHWAELEATTEVSIKVEAKRAHVAEGIALNLSTFSAVEGAAKGADVLNDQSGVAKRHIAAHGKHAPADSAIHSHIAAK